ncbi:UNVERIFIED_CONTAM: hypothetical protein ABIC26_005033 [Paenibacillus sp. PvR008]
MKKKLQVFISSTYTDMIEERQAAVTAVLNAGHIPAGMELFKSGDQSQKETIKRWIDESDVYMLILGGRYGSIDPESGKSYTHWEYDYAGEQGKRRFAIVIDEKRLTEKAKENPDYLERINYTKYQNFKVEVLNNISKFFEDLKDIKLIVMESLKEYEDDLTLSGWIKADNASNIEKILLENSKLLKDNDKLKRELSNIKNKANENELIGGYSFEEIFKALKAMPLHVPSQFEKFAHCDSILSFFLTIRNSLATGITTGTQKGSQVSYTIHYVIPPLMAFGLVEKTKISGIAIQRFQTSKEGHRFIAKYELKSIKGEL